jgi:hypothetical protein
MSAPERIYTNPESSHIVRYGRVAVNSECSQGFLFGESGNDLVYKLPHENKITHRIASRMRQENLREKLRRAFR